MKKVLVIGSGGREHAIAKAFSVSQLVEKVWVAPGNVGMTLDPKYTIETVNIEVNQIESLLAFAIDNKVDLTFVGPEVPLNLGVIDRFRQHQLAIIGPSQQASQLEASKGFAKDLMKRANVPTANYQRFTGSQVDLAIKFVDTLKAPYVIKEDGLAAGKGVIIAQSLQEAIQTVKEMLHSQEREIVIEEFLVGEEFSYFCLVNEDHVINLGTARDYKRAHDNDQGLNTGGMGAFSPVPFVDESLEKKVNETIIQPLLKQMVKEGVPYTGILYAGLMLTEEGPKVIEFNARLGDPETQILLPRIETDFYRLCDVSLTQSKIDVQLSEDYTLGVVLAAKGYPKSYPKGMNIDLSKLNSLDSICFSGTKAGKDGQIEANGGRILMVTAKRKSLLECQNEVYDMIKLIECQDSFYRQDIGTAFI